MVKTLKHILFTLTLCLCIGFAQDVTLTFAPDGTVSYTSDQSISGYQFNHNGCVTGASGGDAEANGFTISSSTAAVLAFSFSGSYKSFAEKK